MKSTRQYRRGLEAVWESLTWPSQGMFHFDPQESQRHAAVCEVLRCLPDADFEQLEMAMDDCVWFIPYENNRAMVWPASAQIFPDEPDPGKMKRAPWVKIIYLGPQLETCAWSSAVGTVAHEFAHLVLDHRLRVLHPDEYEKNESEAWQKVRDWGFEEEAARILRVHRWRESRQK